jgi:uncharacterized iron-regulated protein
MKCPHCGKTVNETDLDPKSPEALLFHLRDLQRKRQRELDQFIKDNRDPTYNVKKAIEKWKAWADWVQSKIKKCKS